MVAVLGLSNVTQSIVEDGESREHINNSKVRANAAVPNRLPTVDTLRERGRRGGGGGEEGMELYRGEVSLMAK